MGSLLSLLSRRLFAVVFRQLGSMPALDQRVPDRQGKPFLPWPYRLPCVGRGTLLSRSASSEGGDPCPLTLRGRPNASPCRKNKRRLATGGALPTTKRLGHSRRSARLLVCRA